MADDDTEETTESTETTTESSAGNDAPSTQADDEEPPAWFKAHLAREEAKKTPKKTAAPKPTRQTAAKPGKPAVATETTDDEKPAVRKKTRVSRAWFGARADED